MLTRTCHGAGEDTVVRTCLAPVPYRDNGVLYVKLLSDDDAWMDDIL